MALKRRVLLVEDDRFLRRACQASLSQRGFDVIVATDGAEGLELARTQPLPDIILLDLLMPRLSGIEVLRAIRQDLATASIPVIILSNSSRDEDKQIAVTLGASGYYVKANLSLKDLAAKIEELIDDSASAPVDLDRLRQFSDGTPEGLRTTVEIFLHDAMQTLEEIAVAVNAHDHDGVRTLAHRAGGSVAACGAAKLAGLLVQLEAPADARPSQNQAALAQDVAREFAVVKAFLEAYLKDHAV